MKIQHWMIKDLSLTSTLRFHFDNYKDFSFRYRSVLCPDWLWLSEVVWSRWNPLAVLKNCFSLLISCLGKIFRVYSCPPFLLAGSLLTFNLLLRKLLLQYFKISTWSFDFLTVQSIECLQYKDSQTFISTQPNLSFWLTFWIPQMAVH